MLLDGAAALVGPAGEPAEDHAQDGDGIDAGIEGRVEAVVLGRDQRLDEARRRRKGQAGDAVILHPPADERPRIADGGCCEEEKCQSERAEEKKGGHDRSCAAVRAPLCPGA